MTKQHLSTRFGHACMMPGVKAENVTSVHQRVTCARCRNTPQFVDAVARAIVLATSRGKRPRRASR